VPAFTITIDRTRARSTDATLLHLAFGERATNDVIVREVDARMRELKGGVLKGGRLVLLNGAASLPAIAVIVHHVDHLFGAVGVFDPKLSGYVIVVSHEPAFAVGNVLPEDAVEEVAP
jgi:CRISPR-associated protein Csx3